MGEIHIRLKPTDNATYVMLMERAANGIKCCLMHGCLLPRRAAELVEWLRKCGIDLEHRCPRCSFIPEDQENAADEFDNGERAGTWACRVCGCEHDPATGMEEPDAKPVPTKESLF